MRSAAVKCPTFLHHDPSTTPVASVTAVVLVASLLLLNGLRSLREPGLALESTSTATNAQIEANHTMPKNPPPIPRTIPMAMVNR